MKIYAIINNVTQLIVGILYLLIVQVRRQWDRRVPIQAGKKEAMRTTHTMIHLMIHLGFGCPPHVSQALDSLGQAEQHPSLGKEYSEKLLKKIITVPTHIRSTPTSESTRSTVLNDTWIILNHEKETAHRHALHIAVLLPQIRYRPETAAAKRQCTTSKKIGVHY